MKTIYLIRHGQAQAGTSHYDRLSPLGKLQADVLGGFLQDRISRPLQNQTTGIQPRGMQPRAIWSGTLKRQLQTARIAHNVEETESEFPNQHAGLNEYDHKAVHQRYDKRGPHQRDASSLAHDVALDMTLASYTEIIQSWITDKAADNEADFESWSEFTHRVHRAVTTIAEDCTDDNAFIYSSGGAISAIIGHIEGIDSEGIANLIWEMKNTSITTLQLKHGKLAIEAHNQVEHLVAHGDPNLITAI